ncbi:MAG: cinnamycin family lantibiotic [Egibacteraceae bacterium]
MLATLPEVSLDAELEELLYHSVVDAEFRAELLGNPNDFGVGYDLFLPDQVEPQDQALLDVASIAAMDVYACASTCSFGPFTVVCDGTTK